MNTPILFIDEKESDNGIEYRFSELQRQLNGCDDVIEFMSDLDLSFKINEYSGEVDYIPSNIFHNRKLVFMHVSLDSPKYPEPLFNTLKRYHTYTIFARFSGEGFTSLITADLRFNRNDHIYNHDSQGFYKFIKFFQLTGRLEFYLLVFTDAKNSINPFEEKFKKAEKIFNNIKRSIKNDSELSKHKADSNFEKILDLAGLDKERIAKGKSYVNQIDQKDDYFSLLEKYIHSLKVAIDRDQQILNTIN